MKKILFIAVLFYTIQSYAQKADTTLTPFGVINSIKEQPQKYKYYFLMIRATGRAEVELTPEMGVTYEDIDALIVSKRTPTRKGEDVIGKKYESYSEAFNVLSNAGLEFVQFVSLSTVGGMTQFLAGDIKFNYTMWRKRITD